jgi:hypothetical protein
MAPAFALAAANAALAQTTFSIDHKGPTIGIPSPTPITEGDILITTGGPPRPGPLPPPTIVIPGGLGGLGLATWAGCVGHPPGFACGVEVDALSYSMDGPVIPGMPPGSWKFSVDQYALGFPSPVPPNVFSESPMPIAEAASDVFIDLGLPPLPGGLCPFAAPPGNTGMIDGNGLPGPSPFGYPGLGLIEPNSRAVGPMCALPDMGDNLDALDVDGPIGPFAYFSRPTASLRPRC